jgi:hypothetical protein
MAKLFTAVSLVMIIWISPSLVQAQECQNPSPNWIFCEDFEQDPFLSQWQEVSHRDRKIRETGRDHVFEGRYSLKLVFPPHDQDGAGWMHHWWEPVSGQEEVYMRWYVKYSRRFDYGQWDVKMAGLEGHLPGVRYRRGAGFVPDGRWFQSRVISLGVEDDRGPEGAKEPFLYYYHPSQSTRWGDFGYQNHGPQVALKDNRWYCIEIGVKPNTVLENPDGPYTGLSDGEQMLWVDGILKAHYTKIAWRTYPDVQINDLYQSAWLGKPMAKVELYRWEDNYVVSRSRVGCIARTDPHPSRNWFIASLRKIFGID